MIRTCVAVSELRSVASVDKNRRDRGLRKPLECRLGEKTSQFRLARARENSPEAIVLTELGNLCTGTY